MNSKGGEEEVQRSSEHNSQLRDIVEGACRDVATRDDDPLVTGSDTRFKQATAEINIDQTEFFQSMIHRLEGSNVTLQDGYVGLHAARVRFLGRMVEAGPPWWHMDSCSLVDDSGR